MEVAFRCLASNAILPPFGALISKFVCNSNKDRFELRDNGQATRGTIDLVEFKVFWRDCLNVGPPFVKWVIVERNRLV